MTIAWCLAAGLTGLGLGLCSGLILRAVITNWESAAVASKTFQTVLLLIFGGGALGATALFRLAAGPENSVFYLAGLGAGLVAGIAGSFYPRIRYTRENVELIVRMSDALREDLPDAAARAVLIFAALERQKPTMAKDLAQAADEAAGFPTGKEDQ